MAIQEPTKLPRWADSPPVAPPTTITEPTEPEKDVGWQPGAQAQIEDIVIDTVSNSAAYQFEVDGYAVAITSDASATGAEIQAALIAQGALVAPINAKVGFSAGPGTNVRITALVAGQSFVLTETDAKLSKTVVQPNKTNKLVRQFLNWIQNLSYLWLLFLSNVRFRWSDIGPHWDIPDTGTLPTTGAGLVGTSGAVSAYVDGRRVVLASAAKTYAASSDTYVDLDRDAVVHYVAVPNADPVPAVTANSLRLWKVVTNATDRTSVADMRTHRVLLNKIVRFLKRIEPGYGLAVDEAHILHRVNVLDTSLLEQVEFNDGGTIVSVRKYTSGLIGDIYTVNAFLNSATGKWNPDVVTGDAFFLRLLPYGTGGTLEVFQKLSAPSEWTQAEWVAGQFSLQQRLKIGADQVGDAAEANEPRLEFPVLDTSGKRTCIAKSGSGANTVHIYWSRGGLGSGLEIVRNAKWDDADNEWDAIDSAQEAQLDLHGPEFKRLIRAASVDWTDDISGSGWTEIFSSTAKTSYFSFTGANINGAAPISYVTAPDLTPEASSGMLEAQFPAPSAFAAVVPLNLPHGAVITSCRIEASSPAGPNQLRAALARIPLFDGVGTMQSLKAGGTPYDVLANGTRTNHDLTVDESAGVRTVDNAAYAYVLWIYSADGGVLCNGRVGYTIRPYAT